MLLPGYSCQFGWCEPRLRSQTAEGRREVAAGNAPGGVCGAEEPGWQNRAFCGPGQFLHDPLDIEDVGRTRATGNVTS